MSDVITLSSDDEEVPPLEKKIKLVKCESVTKEKEVITIEINDDDLPELKTNSVSIKSVKKIVVGDIEIAVKGSAETPLNSTSDSDLLTITRVEEFKIEDEEEESDKHVEDLAAPVLDQFLKQCTEVVKGSQYETKLLPKVQKILDLYWKRTSLHDDEVFVKFLEEKIEKCTSPRTASVSFCDIYHYLTESEGIFDDSAKIESKDLLKVKQLKKICKKLMRKIKNLEEAEIDWDEDEDNSPFIQIDRYTARLNKVYSKYCQLIKKNPHLNRLTYLPLNFNASKYPQINRAINKNHKPNEFKSFSDMNRTIRKVVAKKKLPLTEGDIKVESEFCFREYGKLIKNRRKKELHENMLSYEPIDEDPAKHDDELNKKLKNSYEEGQSKIKEIIEKYVRLQQTAPAEELTEQNDESDSESPTISDSD